MITNNLPKAVIVIPTYNEAGTVGKLINVFNKEIFHKAPNWDIKILFVDGRSPDGTGKIVSEQSKIFPNVYLLEEKKKDGIGSAYLKGFRYAMDELFADVVIEFDADFQHPPETVLNLLSKIDGGYDYVVGSRMIDGGSEPVGRNIFRLALTNFGGWLARFILFFPSKYFMLVTDPTTGLKATRVKGYLDRLDLDETHLHSKKFGYKVQLLSETIFIGARYIEIPFHFENRLAGNSKFELGTVGDILIACLKTRLNRFRLIKHK